ncbi:hypothetical protein KFE25_002872 [Diacronema lutheri]|uniref:Uncharacterized protein n=1 Tax=Diacronema lutheri TaxID=2081491 RepID=A0A8J5XUA4_DIALT|nr:hypothetical protein KFE25_002872 [Diacronema lutheri]
MPSKAVLAGFFLALYLPRATHCAALARSVRAPWRAVSRRGAHAAPLCARLGVRLQSCGVGGAEDVGDDEDESSEDVSEEEMEAAIAAAIRAAGCIESLDAAFYDDDDDDDGSGDRGRGSGVHVLVDFVGSGLSDGDVAWLSAQCETLLEAAGRATCGLTVRLTGNEEVRRLNREYRGKDAPTDILSFSPSAVVGSTPGAGQLLGELAISIPYVESSIAADAQLSEVARAADEARGGAYGRLARERTVARRLPLLVVHGICHLLGHDHETDSEYAEMLKMEEELLSAMD